MRTIIHPQLKDQPLALEADAILRKCVHCGFCTATCPTYQLLGDELDGPRGRIYLIKNLLQENTISAAGIAHLDRCLTCRSCETTCPSGVEYGRLLDIGRHYVNEVTEPPNTGVLTDARGKQARLLSALLRWVVPRAYLFRPLLKIGQLLRPIMPRFLQQHIPAYQAPIELPQINLPDDKSAQVLLLGGCVQSAATPSVNSALVYLLATNGITSKILDTGCCGALDYHLSAQSVGIGRMKTLVASLERATDKFDSKSIVSSATGCGVTIRDYPTVFQNDVDWASRAANLCARVVDAVEILESLSFTCQPCRVAVHTPCSMQHGMKLVGRIEDVLRRAGFEIVPHQNGHLCCGSAGSYSLLQPEIASQLLTNKVHSLEENSPDVIVTANIGCQLHLAAGCHTPVKHWLELLAARLIVT